MPLFIKSGNESKPKVAEEEDEDKAIAKQSMMDVNAMYLEELGFKKNQ